MNICPTCKKQFIRTKKHKKYCSYKCFKIHSYLVWNKWYQKNRKKVLLYKKSYHYNHKLEEYEYQKLYIQKNKKLINTKRNLKRKIDINFKISYYLRNRVRLALKGNPKLSTTLKLVGCSIEKLKQHLESKFTKGMSFNNYGKWHIDHIRPCCSFDLSKESEQKECFNYNNLQPLWAKDNLRKYNKITDKEENCE